MLKIRTWLLILLLLASFAITPAWAARRDSGSLDELIEHSGKGFYTMRNKADGALLISTARILRVGSEFIDPQNRYFRVVSVEGKTAWAEQFGSSRWLAGAQTNILPVEPDALVQQEVQEQNEEEGDDTLTVGIYHSHGAESYLPTDGTESDIEGGGILEVGETLSQSLEKEGVEVIHSKETHVPHDAGAYHRSRRTAEEKLNQGADLIIDVHRDAVPAERYETEVNGEQVTKIMMVVGQQNQNADSNWQLAQDLKNIADQRYPGLVKGILGAEGNYNQDLSANSILIEVGAHENSREEAERAVEMFGEVTAEYLAETEADPGQAARAGRIAGFSAVKLVIALLAALFVYLLVAAGSWNNLKKKASAFFRKEFADLRGGFNFKRKRR